MVDTCAHCGLPRGTGEEHATRLHLLGQLRHRGMEWHEVATRVDEVQGRRCWAGDADVCRKAHEGVPW